MLGAYCYELDRSLTCLTFVVVRPDQEGQVR